MTVLDLDKIAPDGSQKLMLGLTISAWVISFIYYSPAETQTLLYAVGLYNISPSYDQPTIIPLLLFIWMIIGIIDATYIHLKVISDGAIADGMDNCESCVGGKLHISGDWGWIRVGGTKAFPIEGGSVWIGLLTHIHKIGTHIVFEGQMVPKTVMDYIPFELKRPLRQRRNGLFGIETCSVGYISAGELETHKEFNTEKYKEYFSAEELGRIPKKMNTSEFISGICIKNRTVDMGLQLIENEHASLSKSLETISDVGKAIQPVKEKGILQHIFG
ncbi:MAG: hypothetical protein PHP06_05975 [Clostridia bacterium]|nr:hypothetical protein [Clostridia bacterium]